MTIIISVMGRKGGIGKTTFAKNICAAAALQGYSTVLVDADGQGNATDGVRVKRQDGFYELIADNAEWDSVLQPVPPEFTGMESHSFFVLPAFDRQWEIEQNPESPAIIYERLEELRGVIDIVVCDLPPSTSQAHIGLYYASDYVLLPTLCEFDSVQSLGSTLTYLNNAAAAGQRAGYQAAQILGIAPNRFVATERLHQINSGFVRGRYEEKYRCFSPLRDLAVWRKASQLRLSIFALSEQGIYAERVDARKAITELAPITNAIMDLKAAEA